MNGMKSLDIGSYYTYSEGNAESNGKNISPPTLSKETDLSSGSTELEKIEITNGTLYYEATEPGSY